MAAQSRKIIEVYIRRGEGKKERLVSFQPPEEIPQSEMTERNYAFDGHRVVKSVSPTPERTLAVALLEEQKDLIAWLGRYGYSAEFK